jgi:leader peptidase (prepilin peptidase)/N-methyltransferase
VVTPALLAVAALLGLVLGSLANVVIVRVPQGGSLLRPASACPRCGASVRARDNVPVASWLALRGRCRDCGERISARYPLVELASAGLFVAVAARFGLTWALPAYWLFAWTLLCLTAIDLEHYRIPNRLTYPLTPVLGALLVAAALLAGEPGVAVRAVLGGVAAAGLLLGLALISPRGMGLGDVKLAAFLGLGLGYLGWAHVALGLFAAFVLGGVLAIVLLALGLRDRQGQIPFGPWLAAGALVAVLAGQPIIAAYLGVMGLR